MRSLVAELIKYFNEVETADWIEELKQFNESQMHSPFSDLLLYLRRDLRFIYGTDRYKPRELRGRGEAEQDWETLLSKSKTLSEFFRIEAGQLHFRHPVSKDEADEIRTLVREKLILRVHVTFPPGTDPEVIKNFHRKQEARNKKIRETEL